jgi:hypothetical protein
MCIRIFSAVVTTQLRLICIQKGTLSPLLVVLDLQIGTEVVKFSLKGLKV